MCTVSMVIDYARNMDLEDPERNWQLNQEIKDKFAKLLWAAKEFDTVAKQPDCEDPEKVEWLKTNIGLP